MDLDALLDNGDQAATILNKFYPVLLQHGWDDGSSLVGIEADFTLDNPDVQRVLKTLAQKVRAVADTTKADIQRLVGQAAEEGWSNSELAVAIRELGETSAPHRAALIATTESTSAYTKGALLYYGETGVVAKTEWLLSGDACPECQGLVADTPTAVLGEMFAGGVDGPPLHPGCRCALAPVVS
jgi:hypothetical protein